VGNKTGATPLGFVVLVVVVEGLMVVPG